MKEQICNSLISKKISMILNFDFDIHAFMALTMEDLSILCLDCDGRPKYQPTSALFCPKCQVPKTFLQKCLSKYLFSSYGNRQDNKNTYCNHKTVSTTVQHKLSASSTSHVILHVPTHQCYQLLHTNISLVM
jgi:hypothetical protein